MALVIAMAQASSAPAQHPHQEGDDSAATQEHQGFYGPYAMSQDASGTSWKPAASGMEGLHFVRGKWAFMTHGFLNAAYGAASGARGDEMFFSTNMWMLMTQRRLGRGTFGVRFMTSLEPAMGSRGYPLLLQTGETFDGRTPLIDRQHPHDLFMELALTYTLPLPDERSLFLYVAPAGEPALGPPPFMHRPSGADNPLAPISHHWLDSTHISYGVVTVGFVQAPSLKIEVSAFNGHEPDYRRWTLEAPSLNSFATRISVNPTPNLALQASFTNLDSPEALHPGIDYQRLTASALFSKSWRGLDWHTTFAWGRNKRERIIYRIRSPASSSAKAITHYIPPDGPEGPVERIFIIPASLQSAYLAEAAVKRGRRHTVFTRFERAHKDELFLPDDPGANIIFNVQKLELGYIYDFVERRVFAAGAGIAGGFHFIPQRLSPVYGSQPRSLVVFGRLKLR